MTTPQINSKNHIWKIITPILVILIFIVSGLVIIKNELSHPHKNESKVEVRVGNTLPNFSLTKLDGTQIKVSEIPAKVILLNFWATWCDSCIQELPSIVRLRKAFQNRGFEVVGINLDENPEAVIPKLKNDLSLEFPIFKDTEGQLGELFDIYAIPLTVIMDKQRKILYTKDGEFNWDSKPIHEELEKWLNG